VSTAEQVDILNTIIEGLTALENHTHASTRGAAVARVAATSSITPSVSDGAGLGTLGLPWSDLFLASGAVVNWANTDVSLTHSANALAFTGASNGYSFDAAVTIATGGIIVSAGNLSLVGNNAYTSYRSGGAETWRVGDGQGMASGAWTVYDVTNVTPRLNLSAAGLLCLGDDANTDMTIGLTINQGAADNQAFAGKSSDVAHGMTTRVETDTYYEVRKATAATGGAQLRGFAAGSIGMRVIGAHTTGDTTKSAAGVGTIVLQGSLKTGTTYDANGANENVLVVADHGSTRAIIDAEGDLHLDATSNINVWDEHDDIALLEAYRVVTASPVNFRQRFATDVAAHARVLHDTGVVTLNADGRHFVSVKGMFGLLIDAVRQVGGRVEDQAREIDGLRARLALKEG
jgi:hypothetical protein